MSTIIIITPPPKKPPGSESDPDGFAQSLDATSPYAEAVAEIQRAEANGQRVRIIGD